MRYLFQSEQSDLRIRTGQFCEVVRQLTSEEADDEVGPMLKVRFEDGAEVDAFADELSATPRPTYIAATDGGYEFGVHFQTLAGADIRVPHGVVDAYEQAEAELAEAA